MITYQETLTLEKTECCQCGITFAVPEGWLKSKRESGDGFHCPNGHPLVFGKGENSKLKEALAEKERLLTAAKCAELAERMSKEEAQRQLGG